MKNELIEKVRQFREAFGLKQDDVELHKKLVIEEMSEYKDAKTIADKADALADSVFVTAGGIIDGFDIFEPYFREVQVLALVDDIDLPRAVDAVFTSNMSKLCSIDQITETHDKYLKIGVPVHFDIVDEMDESAGFRCICTHSVIGKDGKEYPAGKLLKSVGYVEPDWSYLETGR